MVEAAALHALTAEMHTGALTLATICILVTALCQITVRHKDGMPKSLVKIAMGLRGYTDAVGLVAALIGAIAICASAYFGMQAWSFDQLANDPITRNKILFTAIILAMWVGIVGMRMALTRQLWTCRPLAFLYTIFALAAFGLTSIVGSMGAHLTKGESSLDPLLKWLGFDYTQPIEFNADLMIIAALAAVGLLIMVCLASRWYDLASIEDADACEKKSGYTEPEFVEEEDW
jgi:hypothetical protein